MKLVNWAIAVICLGVFAVFSVLGIQERNQDSFTPAQVLDNKAHRYIPIWVTGALSAAEDGFFKLSADGRSIFVKYRGTDVPGAEVEVLGRVPQCLPDSPKCALEAQTVLPQDSFMKYFYMGGYGFFVWISYALTLIILLLNIIGPARREIELKKALARQLRRQAVPR